MKDKELHTPITFSKYLPKFEDMVMDKLERMYCATTSKSQMQSSDFKNGTTSSWDKLVVSFLIIGEPVTREKLREDILECLHPWPKGRVVFMEDSDPKTMSNYHVINPRSTRHVFDIRIHPASPIEIGMSDNQELFQ